MAVPLVNPVTVPLGGTPVHIAFCDQNGNPLPTGADAPDSASIVPNPSGNPPLPAGIVNIVIDADNRGATFTAVATGQGFAIISLKKGNDTVNSAQFLVTVPWDVTAVGSLAQ